MIRWFRRHRPAVHVTQLSHADITDIAYASAWGLTLTQWNNLTERDRHDKRLNVSYAPGMLEGAGK